MRHTSNTHVRKLLGGARDFVNVRYHHVLLDLDHTLLDTDTSLHLAFADAMNSVGADADDRYPIFNEINQALWRKVEAHELTPPQVHVARFVELNDRLGLEANPQHMADAFAHGMGAHGELYPGARDILDALAGVATLAMVTNGLSEIQRARINRLGLEQYFETITISAEVGVAKPGTEIFDLTFGALGEPDRSAALMVGDNPGSDIAGGNNAGIATCWYNPHGKEGSDSHVSNHTIAVLDQLLPIVTGP